jgi:hypothetical protein
MNNAFPIYVPQSNHRSKAKNTCYASIPGISPSAYATKHVVFEHIVFLFVEIAQLL